MSNELVLALLSYSYDWTREDVGRLTWRQIRSFIKQLPEVVKIHHRLEMAAEQPDKDKESVGLKDLTNVEEASLMKRVLMKGPRWGIPVTQPI